MVSIANPEFAEFFFIHEHFDRYTSDAHGRNQGLWFLPLILLVGLFPWINRGFLALVRPAFQWRAQPASGFDIERFLWVYAVFIFLFFSLGHSMLAPYLLPMFPALALLMAHKLKSDANVNMESWLLIGFGVMLILAGFFTEQLASGEVSVEQINSFRNWALAAVLIMIAAALVVRYFYAAHGMKAVATLAVAALFSLQLLMLGYQHLGENRSSRKLAEVVQSHTNAGAEIYSVGLYPQSLPFYLGQTLQLVAFSSELKMGIQQEPRKWIPDKKSFRAQWLQEQAVAVFTIRDYEKMKSKGLLMRVIFQDLRKVAVTRR